MASIASACTFATIGVVAHLAVFIHGEWHRHVLTIFSTHCVALILLFATQDSGAMTLLAAGGYLSGLFGSIVIYRLCFHSLRCFPGPKIMAISKLAHVYYSRDCKGHFLMDKLYQQYGPLVRTGPNELHIFTENALNIMYQSDGVTNAPLHDLTGKWSCIFSRTHEENRTRRRVFDRGVKEPSVYDRRIIKQTETLLSTLARHKGLPVAVHDLTLRYAYDFMGRVVFAKELNTIHGVDASIVEGQRRALSILGRLAPVPWLIILALRLRKVLRGSALVRGSALEDWWDMEDAAYRYMTDKLECNDHGPEAYCIASEFVREYKSDPDPTKQLATSSKQKSLDGNALTAMVGASDTTSQTVKTLLYHLALYGREAEAVWREVKDVSWADHDTLRRLPYLNGFIEESMRLLPAASTFAFRQTPPEGLVIRSHDLPQGSITLPGDVTLCTSRCTLSKLESAFKQPLEFLPERWSNPEMIIHNSSHPFSLGPRRCPGKEISLRHLRMLVTALIQNYTITFAPGTDIVAVEDGFQSALTGGVGSFELFFENR